MSDYPDYYNLYGPGAHRSNNNGQAEGYRLPDQYDPSYISIEAVDRPADYVYRDAREGHLFNAPAGWAPQPSSDSHSRAPSVASSRNTDRYTERYTDSPRSSQQSSRYSEAPSSVHSGSRSHYSEAPTSHHPSSRSQYSDAMSMSSTHTSRTMDHSGRQRGRPEDYDARPMDQRTVVGTPRPSHTGSSSQRPGGYAESTLSSRSGMSHSSRGGDRCPYCRVEFDKLSNARGHVEICPYRHRRGA
ncbi:hypothetical protein BJ508DRAFT_332836 [Ascobolus immersus RN42]|uniref:Uncharacterized protein n=1 Tax=Ascobolus immersus RN42 TaxID=1160509 RepID=A0A3N4HLP3_ASCIM|nr:hypothetical protein BJ508DRAFT_332836 [Ascobolus immersus RN42]